MVDDQPWSDVPIDLLCAAAPWRLFRWHKGQKHYSGTYWAATTCNFVIYESRLELARLLFADFDSTVCGIVAQPFLLKTEVEGTPRKHVPDYLLITDAGPVVVDVKPRHRLSNPVVASTFAWTQRAVESRGWRYEVWSEPRNGVLENIRFLAGFRRERLFDPELLDELRHADLFGMTIATASKCLPDRPEPYVRAAIHHLLWRRDLYTDLDDPLRASAVLRRTS
ncbi:TnsA-like heteromeric transposase endonuclease subunit [Streptomyces chartreusis]|uniref:TnsA-like heteromeric transposase endonuclease subunit n=1 Tax=Streptomyces chartreusis TaxID=1969 RepID=UPI002E18D40A